MPLDFPSDPVLDELYEGWVWDGSAWNYAGRSVGITTTSSPATSTTTTTTVPPVLPVVDLIAITQSNVDSNTTLSGLVSSGSGITDVGFNAVALGDPIGDAIPGNPNESPFTEVFNPGWGTIYNYRAYATNNGGTGLSPEYAWAHIPANMPGSLSRSGTGLSQIVNFQIFFEAAFDLDFQGYVEETGFLWNYSEGTLPTIDSCEGSVVADNSPILPTPPSPMTASATVGNIGINARAYVKYTSGFYWYSLNSVWVPPNPEVTTTTTSTTTTTTLPGPWYSSINEASGYSSTSVTLSVGWAGGSNIGTSGVLEKQVGTANVNGATAWPAAFPTTNPYFSTVTGINQGASRYFWAYAYSGSPQVQVVTYEGGNPMWYYWYQTPPVQPNTPYQAGAGLQVIVSFSYPLLDLQVDPYECGILWHPTDQFVKITTAVIQGSGKRTAAPGTTQVTIPSNVINPGPKWFRPYVIHGTQSVGGNGLPWYGTAIQYTVI